MKKSVVSLLLAVVLSLSLIGSAFAQEELVAQKTFHGSIVRYYTGTGSPDSTIHTAYLRTKGRYHLPANIGLDTTFYGAVTDVNKKVILYYSNLDLQIPAAAAEDWYPSTTGYYKAWSSEHYNFYSFMEYRYYIHVPDVDDDVDSVYRFSLKTK